MAASIRSIQRSLIKVFVPWLTCNSRLQALIFYTS